MMILKNQRFVAASTSSPAHEPERTIAAHRLVGGQSESGEREDFGRISDPAVVRILRNPEQGLETDVIQRQFPPFGQLGQLIAKAEEAGALERSADGERKRDGLKLRRQIDAATIFAQRGQVRDCVGTQLVDCSPLEIGPSGVGELTIVEGGRSFPFSLGAKGVVENLGHFIGETVLERTSCSPTVNVRAMVSSFLSHQWKSVSDCYERKVTRLSNAQRHQKQNWLAGEMPARDESQAADCHASIKHARRNVFWMRLFSLEPAHSVRSLTAAGLFCPPVTAVPGTNLLPRVWS